MHYYLEEKRKSEDWNSLFIYEKAFNFVKIITEPSASFEVDNRLL